MESLAMFRKSSIKFLSHVEIIAIALLCVSCNKKQITHVENPTSINRDQEVNTKTSQEEVSYHIDSSHQYEHRTGSSGHYEYTYDVIGNDIDNNELSGSVSIQGNQGKGMLIDTENNEIEVDVEWIDHGKIKATDENGNEYELEVI
ncbi:hypothetical protein [Flavobacterium sp.]|uniref:hypothetical protein n=1 Tax=Flavobacterium sp. TaxID=239 RepID=UPI00286D66F0|nr:hypothetical protein [Flavobacterium sp.]